MMKTSHSKIIFKAPFNHLSFGQVSYNLIKEMFKRGMNVSLFPIGNNADFSCFDKMTTEFYEWFKNCINNKHSGIDRNTPCLQLWHLRDSETFPVPRSNLFTFHEILGVTDIEKSVCHLHEKVIFSSSFSKENFQNNGVKNAYSCSIGFDEDLEKTDRKYIENVIHFGLIGKFEYRKNTELIIKTWLELYGNNPDFRLTCLIDNPFFPKDAMSNLTSRCCDGKEYFNITFLPRLKTNSEMNDLYNSIDIDLSGLSSAEGWNLPAFNATALGKWSCVLNHTAHKDWATIDNSILVEPESTREAYDELFFKKGDQYNQGEMYAISKDTLKSVLLKSQSYAKKENPEGEKLRTKFSYKNTLDNLLKIIDS